MRYLLFIFFLSFSLAIAAQNSQKDLGEFIYKVPLKKQISLKQVETEWWNEYVEWPLFDKFFSDLTTKIDSGKIQVMLPEYPFSKIASASDVRNALHTFDSAQVENINTGGWDIEVSEVNLYLQDLTSITFCEEWFYDEKELSLTKKVKGFLLNARNIDRNTGGLLDDKPLLYVPCDASYRANEKSQERSPDIRTIPFLTYDLKIDSQYVSKTESHINPSGSAFLISKFIEAAQKNKKKITKPNFPFTTHPDKKELKELLPKLSTVNDMKFYEEWDFDLNKLSFEKKVKGVILAEQKNKNDTITEKKLAFVPLNDFVPNDPYALSKIQIDKIESTIQFANFNLIPGYINLNRVSNSDSIKMMLAAASIANDVKHHKLKAFPSFPGYNDPDDLLYHRPLTDSIIDRLFFWNDTLITQSLENGMLWDSTILKRELDYKLISGFRFFESWSFDLTTFRFEKKIKNLGCMFPIIDNNTGDVKFMESKINVDIPVVDPSVIMQSQNLFEKNITYSVPIDWDIRNACGEYMTDGSIGIDWDNSRRENLYQYQKYPFVQGLIDGVLAGKINAVNAMDNKELKPEEVKLKIESMKDSTFIKAGDLSTDYTLVNRIRFSEDWYFDPITKAFYKKVNSITLIHAVAIKDPPYNSDNWKENPIFTLNLK